MCFEPDSNCSVEDQISPILDILNNQRASYGNKQIEITQMKPFLRGVLKAEFSLPTAVKSLPAKEKQELKEICGVLQETYFVFASVNTISYRY